MNKKYYFIVDYNTKYGTIKKGQSLTGRLSSASKTRKVMFDFYEITDPVKAEAGEGIFSINETDLKNFASDVAPKKDGVVTTEAPEKISWWNRKTKPQKALIVSGSALVVLTTVVLIYKATKK